ncbi:MAG: hypothetical protein Q8941_23770 [Bacteroidota bacterium]|nr:hypothetical protein [Bacteroidota bacterium]
MKFLKVFGFAIAMILSIESNSQNWLLTGNSSNGLDHIHNGKFGSLKRGGVVEKINVSPSGLLKQIII